MVEAFGDEDRCRELLEAMVWPRSRICPACGFRRSTALAGRDEGAIKVFTDVCSGRNMDRPGLQELLAYARKATHWPSRAWIVLGDPWAIPGRSLGELLATVTMLKERGVALLSLEEKIDTSSVAGELIFHVRRHCALRAPAHRGTHEGRHCGSARQRQAARAPAA